MADRFPIILNTSANQLQELASGDTLDVSGAAIKSNLVDSLSVVGTGVSIVGVVTATSFVGSGANLSGIDITAVKDSGGNVKIQAQDSGAIYTGIHTFGSTTSFTSGVFNGTVTSTGAVVNGDTDLNGDIDVQGDLDVDGHTNLDNVSIAGVATFADNKAAYFGTDGDFYINHSGSSLGMLNTTGDTLFRNTGGAQYFDCNQISLRIAAGSQTMLNAAPGGVTLYTSNSSKLATSSTGVSLPQDLDVDGHTNLDNVSVAGVTTFAGAINGSSAAFTGDVSVAGTLTYEDVKNVDSVGVATARTGLKVLAGGANVVGVVTASNGIFVPDNQTIHIGNASGSGDLRLYHDGTHSYIQATGGTGNTIVKTGSNGFVTNSGSFYLKSADNSTSILSGIANGAVTAYFNTAKKFETTNTGVTITGNATATTFIGALTGTASGNTTITNNADNRVITGGSGNALTGESNVIVDSSRLMISGNGSGVSSNADDLVIGGVGDSTQRGITIASTSNGNIRFADGGDNATGMIEYDHGSNFMRFYVEAGEALRIEGNRRVLIGQTVNTIIGGHLARLQIGGTDYNSSTVSITNNTNDANGAYLMLAKQRSGSPGGNTIVTSGDEVGVVRFCASDGSDMAHRVAQISAEVDGTPGSNDMPGRLSFATTADGGTTSSVRMTIKNNGRVGINETNPSEILYVAGNIYATGNVTAYSDIRVKENVKEISNALEAVDKIRGVSYTRKDTKEDTLGVSAQEVESMFPELVVEDNHGMKSVNYNGLVGVLFSAVKELSTKLKEIEDK